MTSNKCNISRSLPPSLGTPAVMLTYILTSLSFLHMYHFFRIEVRLGEWDTETTVDCMGDECADPLVDVKVERVSIFPFYNVSLLIGDIALLRLATPVNFTGIIFSSHCINIFFY